VTLRDTASGRSNRHLVKHNVRAVGALQQLYRSKLRGVVSHRPLLGIGRGKASNR